MSTEDGSVTHSTVRVAVVLLAAVGLTLSAVVLPAAAGAAGGTSLSSDIARELGGSGGGSAAGSGDDSLVSGLLGQLPSGGGPSAGGGLGGGRGTLGALEAGPQTGVGSQSGGVSEGLRSQSTTPHFVVRSPEPGYWRTRAYSSYTGTGWEAGLGGTRSLPVSSTVAAGDRRTVEQRVTLREPARSLPAMWQPTRLDAPFAEDVTVTERGALQAGERLPANTTYTVESSLPPRDPARLRDAGTNYPNRVGFRYTDVPDSTPDRVAERTAEITADADTPYETAVAIEQWLEANKRYSLDASHDGGDVTDQFLFEMETGYCEYFATSMTVMLRTQGIPARYVVGYSTGQPQGEDTYVVRGMNAHAWVEVYFPDTGWVRFDPTPGRDRVASEAAAFRRAAESGSIGADGESFENASRSSSDESDGSEGTTGTASDDGTADSYDHAETGSPGETFDASGPAYRVSLAADPAPGRDVPVRVERGGDPVTGASVTVNGRPAGTTNASGLVRAPVPYASELVVEASDPGADGTDPNATTRTFALPTDIDIETPGATAPGASTTLSATLADAPVADANVSLDGNAVGRTDDAGRLSVTLPANETATVAVTRGAASGTRTLRLADVRVNTSGFALPGLSVTATVTDGGRPVDGATVTVGGATAETGPDGRTSVGLPLGTGATLTVETPAGLTRTVAVPYRYGTLGVLVAFVLALAAVGAWLWRRADATGRSLRRQVAVTLRRLAGRGLSLLVGFATRAERVGGAVRAATDRARTAVAGWLAGAVAALRGGSLPPRPTLPVPDVRALGVRVRAAVAGFVAALAAVAGGRGAADAADATAADDRTDRGSSGTPDAATRLRRTWREFEAQVPVADPTTKTPGELARRAVATGFPESAVYRLRDAVRAVEYGRANPGDYADDVADAERELAGATEGGDDE